MPVSDSSKLRMVSSLSHDQVEDYSQGYRGKDDSGADKGEIHIDFDELESSLSVQRSSATGHRKSLLDRPCMPLPAQMSTKLPLSGINRP